MKLILEIYDNKYTVEISNDELTAYEFLEIIKGLMHQITYNNETINKAILELAAEIN
jgi:hypothetical protein